MAAPSSPGQITPQRLASFLGVDPKTVKRWCQGGLLKSRKRFGDSMHVISVDEAIRFAEQNALPTEALQRYADLRGGLMHRTPSVIIASPDTGVLEAFGKAKMDATPCKSWFHIDLLIARRAFDGAVLDSSFGRLDIEERAGWFADFSPRTIVLVILRQQESAAMFRGVDQCIRAPYSSSAVAQTLWAKLRARMPASAG